MKHLILFITLFLVNSIYSQNCTTGFYPFKNGASWELTTNNPDNKLISKSSTKINSVTTTATGYKANVAVKGEDAKGKETSNSTYDVECANNVFKMDMKNFITPDMMKQFKDMTIELSGDQLETPGNIKVGDSLKNSMLTMTVKSNNVVVATVTILIYERKVLAKEDITVPAGTYSAFKVSYKTKVTTAMTGMTLPANEASTTEWLSAGVGMVKSENYTKGKLTGTTLLTKFAN